MPALRSARRERVRQARQPLAQQGVDLRRVQAGGDAPHARRVGATQDAVVERLEGDALLGQLALEVLVAVDAQLGVVREVRAELDEQRPEVLVHEVHVVVVDHRRRRRQPRVGPRTGSSRRSVRTTRAFSCALPMYSNPSVPANPRRYARVRSSLRSNRSNRTRSTPSAAA